ncbi:ferrous iron transport protein B [Clostridium collagenovorans DSM 3089]|uniref:Ferrous iron transport protein B n=1 Tax=Clostridium collagenovorans DSM 3089 TaxID=1121306 RepID=A0A1M5TLE2_9CLOT|nr:ferrous iron transport protein B [Clostridium collagenovorans]SHH51203.1 ferrous iron transport protein B [Clostridium collagenovorans DSM 3089]
MKIAALIGNPNVGKTTLFNSLTGSKQHVGNWAGVTVDKKEGYFTKDIKIVDLPGIYAMDTYSNEEKVSKEFLANEEVSVILNIVDASNLERNLYLTTQLKEFNKPIVLILNMIDVAKEKGIEIDYDNLAYELGVTVVPITASKKDGLEELKSLLKRDYNYPKPKIKFFTDEKDTYSYIEGVLEKSISRVKPIKKESISDKLDKIVLNKFISIPLFLLILFLIFKFTFSWVGQPLSDLLGSLVDEKLVPFLHEDLSSTSPWFSSLLVDGIVAGVGAVIVFVPIIMALFLGISFLEDSGYMARTALITDRIMRKMGLSGKAFIPLIVGFGCSVPAIMSARTLESEKDRKLTALLVPLMSCNARLPVYALFASAFFPGKETTVVFSLYLLGIILAFIMGILFKKTIFKKDEEPFLIELPEYKLPSLKNLALHTWEKGKGFIKKAGTVIFALSVIMWFLSNFNFTGMVDMNDSFLSYIGKFINPIFVPLGFGTWQNSVSILSGLMAKEVVIGTMGVIYGANLEQALLQHFTTLSAISFLVFTLLYTPCVSVISTMKKEFGNKMATFSVVYQFTLAWIISFAIYQIGSLIF